MILKDYECELCGEVMEEFVDSKNIPDTMYCPICNGVTHKIVSMSQTSPIDAAWINTVLEVVDKDSDKPHCKEFLRHPNRANYKAWMQGEGLRPLEPGEKPKKVDKKARKKKIKKKLIHNYREREAISI